MPEPTSPAVPRPCPSSRRPPAPRPRRGRRHAGPAPPALAPALIDISEFAKVELRVALVTAAEKIAGSKKLLKLQVDLGDGAAADRVRASPTPTRPESLVGKKVALVANLKPAKLMGVESNGMVLAASIDGKAVLCTFDTDVPPGTKIK